MKASLIYAKYNAPTSHGIVLHTWTRQKHQAFKNSSELIISSKTLSASHFCAPRGHSTYATVLVGHGSKPRGKILLGAQLCVECPIGHKMCEDRAAVPGVSIKMRETRNAVLFFQHKWYSLLIINMVSYGCHDVEIRCVCKNIYVHIHIQILQYQVICIHH